MKASATVWFVFALTVASASAAAQTPQTSTPFISVSGAGEARVVPDRATVLIGVQIRGTTATAAGAENARRQRAILDTLRALGISGERVSTANYTVSPDIQYSPNNSAAPKVIGYAVTSTVKVDVVKLDDVGKVIDAALGRGANELTSLQFFSSRADSARKAALAAAVANARADAEVLVRAAGGSLGPLADLSTGEPPVRPIGMSTARLASQSPTPIEPGQQTIEATVSARWVFIPGR